VSAIFGGKKTDRSALDRQEKQVAQQEALFAEREAATERKLSEERKKEERRKKASVTARRGVGGGGSLLSGLETGVKPVGNRERLG